MEQGAARQLSRAALRENHRLVRALRHDGQRQGAEKQAARAGAYRARPAERVVRTHQRSAAPRMVYHRLLVAQKIKASGAQFEPGHDVFAEEMTMKPYNLTHALQRIAAVVVLLAGCFGFSAHAEQSELRIAKQYGLLYMQMMVMEDQKIIEKNAKAAGLGDLKVTWATFRSSDV